MKLRNLITFGLSITFMAATAQTHLEGIEYYKADQISNAKELLARNYDKSGTDKSLSDYYMGLICLKENKLDEAQKYFNKGLQSSSPFSHYNKVGLATILLKKGDVKGAENLIKEAEKLAKKDADFQIEVARAYFYADPVAYDKQITQRVEKARKVDMTSPAALLFEGDVFATKKDVGNAATKYDMVTTYDPKGSYAYVKYANLFTQVNPDFAIQMLKKLLEQNPESALGQRELANAYYNKKDYKNATKYYGKYVQNPNHFKQDEDRFAFLLFYDGAYKRGYDYATYLLKNDPSNFTAQRYQFMNAAQLPEMKDQMLGMADALYSAHKAKESNKFAPIDYTLIAEEYRDAKRYDDAIEVLLEANRELPDNANFSKTLSFTYMSLDNMEKAADAYNDYISKSKNPTYNDFIQQALLSYFAGLDMKKNNSGDANKYFTMAEDFAKKALETSPNEYKPLKIQGDIAKQRASKDMVDVVAVPFYENSIQLLETNDTNPSSTAISDVRDMCYYVGNYYYAKKNNFKAKEYFNKSLKYNPNDDQLRKFVNSIK